MTFKQQRDTLTDFIKDNYKNYLPDELKNFELTLSFLDFDRFKNNFTIFVDFTKINFPDSSYKDDCEDIENLALAIYLVHRNNTGEILQNNNLDSAYAFYEMLKHNPRLGIAESAVIESIDFYNYVEGNKFLVVSEIVLSLQTGL